MKMKEKTKNKIYDLLYDFNPDGRIAGGIVAFLETEDNAQEMIKWLETSDKNKWTEHSIIDKSDKIIGLDVPEECLRERGLI